MHCKDCRHWKGPEPDWAYENVIQGKCSLLLLRDDIFTEAYRDLGIERSDVSDWDEVERIEGEALAKRAAWCQDGSGYSASLITQGHFGCILFEAKP